MEDIELFKKRVERERAARQATESLLEDKSRELYASNEELRELAERVARREARLHSILDSTFEAVCVTDAAGCIASANPSMTLMLGYSEEELQLTNINKVIRKIPTLAEGMERTVTESVGMAKDGSEVPIDFSVSPTHYGDTLDYTWVLRDVTPRKEAEAELRKTQEDLIEASRQAGMADVASSVLHNVGNVLNSVSTSAELLHTQIETSRLSGLQKVVDWLAPHAEEPEEFFKKSKQAAQLVDYLAKLSEQLNGEQSSLRDEVSSLLNNIQHIKEIVRAQQSYARRTGVEQTISMSKMVKDILAMNARAIEQYGINVSLDLAAETESFRSDKHSVMQILGNVTRNAIDSLIEAKPEAAILSIKSSLVRANRMQISVADNGLGISEDNLKNLFSMGFTTKANGHGFGLHSSALAAKQLAGELLVESDGLGGGAEFILELPLLSDDLEKTA